MPDKPRTSEFDSFIRLAKNVEAKKEDRGETPESRSFPVWGRYTRRK